MNGLCLLGLALSALAVALSVTAMAFGLHAKRLRRRIAKFLDAHEGEP